MKNDDPFEILQLNNSLEIDQKPWLPGYNAPQLPEWNKKESHTPC